MGTQKEISKKIIAHDADYILAVKANQSQLLADIEDELKFSKGSSFSSITEQRIKEIVLKLNSRPRKRFNYQNPIFVMDKLLFNQKVAFMS